MPKPCGTAGPPVPLSLSARRPRRVEDRDFPPNGLNRSKAADGPRRIEQTGGRRGRGRAAVNGGWGTRSALAFDHGQAEAVRIVAGGGQRRAPEPHRTTPAGEILTKAAR